MTDSQKLIELNLGVATLNQTPLDWTGNFQRIAKVIHEAREKRVALLCLPELCITGYGCEDMFLAPFVHKQALAILKQIIPLTHSITVSVGLPLFYQGHVYNCVAILSHKRLAGFVCKQNLANTGVYYEHRWFKPWIRNTHTSINLWGKSYPLGDLIFSQNGIRFAFEICEDAWIKDRALGKFIQHDVRIVLNPSASHFSFNKIKTRYNIVNDSSRHIKGVYLYANLHGLESGRLIFDGGGLISVNGKVKHMTPRFPFTESTLCTHTVSLKTSPSVTSKTDTPIITTPVDLPASSKEAYAPYIAEKWEGASDLKKEEFTRAVGLGLFDYLRKSNSQCFVVSLSGGIDSSACVLLIHYMLKQMQDSLGQSAFTVYWRTHFTTLPDTCSLNDIMQKLLICVYQKTTQSSKETEQAAKKLAAKVQAHFYSLDIQDLVTAYLKTAESTLNVNLNWQSHDIPLQNIQARTRSPLIWLFANLHRGLLLTTSNRSEAAVGYATMDGDTSGGLAPLGGIDKHFLRQWMSWIGNEGPLDMGFIKEALTVLKVPPTAELRPKRFKQEDEKDLMPYDLLNEIEILAIRDKKSPKEVLAVLTRHTHFKHLSNLKLHVIKFFKLWSVNQWKRERYAPSFHLDDQNLDPKTWCRFPILSGNFAQELSEL